MSQEKMLACSFDNAVAIGAAPIFCMENSFCSTPSYTNNKLNK
jgi:hypothetical protein